MDETYRHWTGRVLLTAGVKWLCDTANCWWLADAIVSYQQPRAYPQVTREEFQHWILEVRPDRSATLSMNRGNDEAERIVEQHISWTDYPEDRCELYLIYSPGVLPTLLQPCEY